MTDDPHPGGREPWDQALDLFVYAPLGLAFSLPDMLPQLVQKGREQVTVARAVGQFAVGTGQKEANKLVRRLIDGRRGPGGSGTPTPGPSPQASAGPAPQTSAAPAPPPGAPDSPTVPLARSAPIGARDATSLAIPGYDILSASQVVPRLAGLTHAELEAVRSYEAAGRGRKTVLNRVAQLQAAT